jgi:hypothetical protein
MIRTRCNVCGVMADNGTELKHKANCKAWLKAEKEKKAGAKKKLKKDCDTCRYTSTRNEVCGCCEGRNKWKPKQ